MAYQRYMPKECNYTAEVVQITEAYRNAANYVVIFLKKPDPADNEFNEVVELYDNEVRRFTAAIRQLHVTKRLTDVCYDALTMMEDALITTGDSLVTGTIMAYTSKCPTSRIQNSLSHRPIDDVSNDLN